MALHIDCCDLCLLILAIFLPPVSIALKIGCCDAAACLHLIFNIILCFLLWIPAVIHACIIILVSGNQQGYYVQIDNR